MEQTNFGSPENNRPPLDIDLGKLENKDQEVDRFFNIQFPVGLVIGSTTKMSLKRFENSYNLSVDDIQKEAEEMNKTSPDKIINVSVKKYEDREGDYLRIEVLPKATN